MPFKRSVALVLLLALAAGCPSYAVRAPIGPCTRACQTIDDDGTERARCLYECPGARRSHTSCQKFQSGVTCAHDDGRLAVVQGTGLVLGIILTALLLVYPAYR